MTRSRTLFGILIVAAVALVGAFLAPSPARWVIVTAATLVLGFALGLICQRRELVRQNQLAEVGQSAASDFTLESLKSTMNEMREGLLVIDSEMRVVASNRAARDLFSSPEESVEFRRLTELTRNPSVYDAFLDGVRGTERSGVKVETHSPARRVFDLRVVPLKSSRGGRGAVGVFFDVTRLERLEVIRQEFLSNVSHELRTPLTAIVALTETLETGAIDDGENNRRFLLIIQKNAARMRRLIDDILELSAIEAGNIRIRPETVHLRPLVEEVLSSLSTPAISRGVTLQNLVPPETEVFADPHRMMQMLTNLIENGIKFNREGGTVSIKAESGSRDRILVTDTGEGIPSHHLDRSEERR